MKLGIMQPYFFPYIGYFQLINAVDKFVILDDVNYIKGGWINRNRILKNIAVKWLTVPLDKSSSYKLIQDINLIENSLFIDKLIRQVESAYKKAPYFSESYQLFEKIISFPEKNLSKFLLNSLKILGDILDIPTYIEPTSSIYPKNDLKGQERILDICIREKATHYINLPGGKDIYDANLFEDHGIKLSFLEPKIIPYNQNTNQFIPYLSILDVLMWNSPEDVLKIVKQYELSE